MRRIRTGIPEGSAAIIAVYPRTRTGATSECLVSAVTASWKGAARRIPRPSVTSAIPRTPPVIPPRTPESVEVRIPCTRRTITPKKMYRTSQITVNARNPPQEVGRFSAECRPGTSTTYKAEAARNAPTMAARSITPAKTPYRVPRSIETSTIARVVQSIQFTVRVRAIPSERPMRASLAEPHAGPLLEGYSNLLDDFLRFLRGERPVRRAQPQAVREVPVRIGHGRSGVHVEQLDRLEQRTGRIPDRFFDLPRRQPVRRDHRHVPLDRRVSGETRGCPIERDRGQQRLEIHLGQIGPVRQPVGGSALGAQFPDVAYGGPPEHERRGAARI